MTAVLCFATIFVSCVSAACPTLRERFADGCERFAKACGRLRTLCGHNATTSRRLLDPWTPTLKREPFCYAFGENPSKKASAAETDFIADLADTLQSKVTDMGAHEVSASQLQLVLMLL